MKNIIINGLQYKKNSSGIGVMIKKLTIEFARITKYRCKIVLPKDSNDFPKCANLQQIRIVLNYKDSLMRMFFQSFFLGSVYARNSILVVTDSKVPFFLPKSCILIPIITDLAVFRMPNVYQISRFLWWRFQYRYLCKKAKKYIAISQFTKKEMIELLKVNPNDIYVVPCAASDNYKAITDEKIITSIRRKYKLPEKYLLFVGNQNPRKNLDRILKAFDLVVEQENIGYDLVIAGEQGWNFSREKCLSYVKHRERVHFIGYVDDNDMPTLYSEADLFLFPTLYEGFGIPILEAQMCGTIVITSNVSSMPEIGRDSVIYVDPLNVDDIANKIANILKDKELIKILKVKGLENAKRYNWKKSAELLNKIICEVVPI